MLYVKLFENSKRLAFAQGHWTCRLEGIRNEICSFVGFVVPPYCQPSKVSLFANQARLRCDIRTEGAAVAGFAQRTNNSGLVLAFSCSAAMGDETELRCVDDVTGDAIGRSIYFNPQVFVHSESPKGKFTQRTNRADSLNFIFTGYDDHRKLAHALRNYLQNDKQNRILDWGVGSGRVAQFFVQDKRFDTFGCDIDPVNMTELHRLGYDPSKFIIMAPGGAIPFPNDFFDFSYGISVFTHLTEDLQDFYLGELQRVLRPGGVGLFSFHGNIDFFTHINNGRLFREVTERGILVLSESKVLKDGFEASVTDRLYVNTLHSLSYVLKKWGGYFSKVNVIDGPSISYQDFAMCIKHGS